MPRATWGVWGGSSKPPFVDQVAEAGLMSPGDFAHEILVQLQVALRAGQADVPKVRSQKRQLCAEIDVLFTPQQKPENGKRMSQVMETNVPVAATDPGSHGRNHPATSSPLRLPDSTKGGFDEPPHTPHVALGILSSLSRRRVMPVMQVAQTAQRITGSNLSLRIPTRAAGDELDYLILTFNRMIERLENSFQQIRQFSTDVSHELRTPITAIRGQLEVALFTAKTVEQYRDATLNSLQDIERLSQIVRALLLLSQAESGQLALQKTRLDLSSVVRDIVDQFQIPAEGAHVELSADLPPECAAEVDRVQIERMLSNLLSNALKFTPAGGRVHVALRSLPESISIDVEDTGCGIPEEHIPHI